MKLHEKADLIKYARSLPDTGLIEAEEIVNASIPEVVNKRFKKCREYCDSDWQAMVEATHFFASMCASMIRCHLWEGAEFWAKCELEAGRELRKSLKQF